MKDQKAENLLNLALSVPEEERKQTGELDVGYDRETRTWELIVKYSGDLAGIVGSSFQKRSLRSCPAALEFLQYRRKKFRGSLSLKKLNMQKNQRGCSLP